MKVRRCRREFNSEIINVSIHAPVKVRPLPLRDVLTRPVSIHAPVKVRLPAGIFFTQQSSFNSRTREGATAGDVEKLEANIVSIHAPVKVRH